MKDNEFNEKIEEYIRQSAQKVTPPPFSSVLQKIAQDNTPDDYEIFYAEGSQIKNLEQRAKHLSPKIIGIAAAVAVFIGLGSAAVVMLGRFGIAKSESSAMDNYQMREDTEFGAINENNSSESQYLDEVSNSDLSSDENDTSSY